MLSTILSGAKDIYRRDFAHLADQHDCCFSMLKMSQNFNHNFHLYKNKTIQNTYVIILSNQPHQLNMLNDYDFEHYPGYNDDMV